jgi:hypothetical protein
MKNEHPSRWGGLLRTGGRSIALLATLSSGLAAFPSVYPTGTTRLDPSKAWLGYVVFSGADNKTHLIDLAGNEVHQWPYYGFPAYYVDPALAGGARGHVVLQTATLEKDPETGTSLTPGQRLLHGNAAISELDWAGNTVWAWSDKAPGSAARQHHDVRRLPGGDTLVLANLIHSVKGFKADPVYDDVAYIVAPDGSVKWSWKASEHLDELGLGEEGLRLLKASGHPDFLHINDLTTVGPNHWAEAGDTRFAPDNLIFDSREANFVAIIDRKSGKIVWHLGPNLPAWQGSEELGRPVDQFSGQHDAHIIPQGLPGAGDLLLFDNQGEGGYPQRPLAVQPASRVLEVDPVKGTVVWQYSAVDSGVVGWDFYSSFISSARRLPNGNTLIDEGVNGRFFQVTPQGEIVWEYVSPYFGDAPFGPKGSPVRSNYVYRALPVPYEWAPEGTPHAEKAVVAPAPEAYHLPTAD